MGTRAQVALAAAVGCALTAAVTLISLALLGGGVRPPVPAAAPQAGRPSLVRQVRATDPAPVPRRHRDPLAASAASYVSTRTGTVLAAVYDIATGQTWRLGRGRPQAEASVVKLDVLETLLAERGEGHPGLSAADQALASA